MQYQLSGKRRRTLPCIRLLFFFITGILLYDHKNIPIIRIGLPALLVIVFLITHFMKETRFRIIVSASVNFTVAALLVCSGYRSASVQDIRNHPQWLGQLPDSSLHHCAGILETRPVRKSNSFQARLRVEFVSCNKEPVAASGLCLVYFRLADSLQLPPAGAYICFSDTLRQIRSQQIPGAFDYASYCNRQGIYHQLSASRTAYRQLYIPVSNTRKRVSTFFSEWQEQLSLMLQKRMSDPQAAGMAAALLVGFKAELDPELSQTYAATGVSHVIAISGMHLGLIYWLITLLLSLLPLPERVYWIKPLTAIIGIWAFSLLTGAGPSVLRAAVMFSFLSGEQFFHRKMPSLNGWAASALVLLFLNPAYLYDAGFLLSYAAVLSLLLFYQPVYQLFYFRKKAADLIWKTIAVTLAAQVVTFPVSLYFFHQFPVYFLPANLIAVPLSTLLLFLAIGVELLYGNTWASGLLGTLLEKGIQCMNSSMQFIEQLPGAVWSPLQVSPMQVAMLYMLLFGLHRYWTLRLRHAIWMFLSAALLWGGSRIWATHLTLQQQVLVLYPNRQQDAADLFSGIRVRQLDTRDSSVTLPLPGWRIACRRYFRSSYTETLPAAPLLNRHIDLGALSLLQVNGLLREPPTFTRKSCILWLCREAQPDLAAVFARIPDCRVVIGSRVSRKKAAAWMALCREKGIPCHDLVDKGAFVMPLQ